MLSQNTQHLDGRYPQTCRKCSRTNGNRTSPAAGFSAIRIEARLGKYGARRSANDQRDYRPSGSRPTCGSLRKPSTTQPDQFIPKHPQSTRRRCSMSPLRPVQFRYATLAVCIVLALQSVASAQSGLRSQRLSSNQDNSASTFNNQESPLRKDPRQSHCLIVSRMPPSKATPRHLTELPSC